MSTRRSMLVGTASAMLGAGSGCRAPAAEDHTAWVDRVLRAMLAIRPGMTRSELMRVFTTEGGISNRWQQTFASRECPYFKVNVRFSTADNAAHDAEEHGMGSVDQKDVIQSISEPYLALAVID